MSRADGPAKPVRTLKMKNTELLLSSDYRILYTYRDGGDQFQYDEIVQLDSIRALHRDNPTDLDTATFAGIIATAEEAYYDSVSPTCADPDTFIVNEKYPCALALEKDHAVVLKLHDHDVNGFYISTSLESVEAVVCGWFQEDARSGRDYSVSLALTTSPDREVEEGIDGARKYLDQLIEDYHAETVEEA